MASTLIQLLKARNLLTGGCIWDYMQNGKIITHGNISIYSYVVADLCPTHIDSSSWKEMEETVQRHQLQAAVIGPKPTVLLCIGACWTGSK